MSQDKIRGNKILGSLKQASPKRHEARTGSAFNVPIAALGVGLIMLSGCGYAASQPTPPAVTRLAVQASATAPATSNVPLENLYGAVVAPGFTLPPQKIAQLSTPVSTFAVFATNPGENPVYGPVISPVAPAVSATPITPVPTATITPSVTGTPPTATPTIPTATLTETPIPTMTYTPTITPVSPTLTPAPPTGTPAPALRADLMGIQIHPFITDAEWDAMLSQAQVLGVKWIKIQVAWREYEPAKGNYNTAFNDIVLKVQRSSIRGFKTMISIAKAPGWARPANANYSEDGPPANPKDLADFTTALIRNIKPEFLDAVEVWNEPNLQREWRDAPLTGTAYFPFFAATYDAIQGIQNEFQPVPGKENHRITVITAAPAPTSTAGDGGSLDDITWMEQLYQAGLARYTKDIGIGVHPYGWGNDPNVRCCAAATGVTGWFEDPHFYFLETVDRYLQIKARNNHNARLWVTEFGWATYDGLRKSDGNPAAADPRVGWQAILSQNQQADYVARAFQIMQQPPYSDQMGPMMLWNMNFALVADLVDQSREEAGFSLLDQNGNPRPVFNAIAGAPKIVVE